MKKVLLSIIIVLTIILTISAIGFAKPNGNLGPSYIDDAGNSTSATTTSHVVDKSKGWFKTDTYHYYPCKACFSHVYFQGSHTFSDGMCSTCKYVCTHSSTSWKSNGAKHWKACDYCGTITEDKVNHNKLSYTDNADGSTHTKKCSTCGYSTEENHVGSKYRIDGNQHVQLCACGAEIGDAVNHEFQNASFQSANEDGHTYLRTCVCGKTQTSTNPHSFSRSHKCVTCKYEVKGHIFSSGGKCKMCGEEMTYTTQPGLDLWTNYAPNDPTPGWTGGTFTITITNGKLDKDLQANTLTGWHYYIRSQRWHDTIGAATHESQYCDQLVAADQLYGYFSRQGSISADRTQVTYSSMPSDGIIGFELELPTGQGVNRRYCVGSRPVQPDPSPSPTQPPTTRPPTTNPPTTTRPPETTRPPVTTTPPTTTRPPTTNPPTTTRPPETTRPPVTTTPPVTTRPPVTTTPPTTTRPPVTTMPPTTPPPVEAVEYVVQEWLLVLDSSDVARRIDSLRNVTLRGQNGQQITERKSFSSYEYIGLMNNSIPITAPLNLSSFNRYYRTSTDTYYTFTLNKNSGKQYIQFFYIEKSSTPTPTPTRTPTPAPDTYTLRFEYVDDSGSNSTQYIPSSGSYSFTSEDIAKNTLPGPVTSYQGIFGEVDDYQITNPNAYFGSSWEGLTLNTSKTELNGRKYAENRFTLKQNNVITYHYEKPTPPPDEQITYYVRTYLLTEVNSEIKSVSGLSSEPRQGKKGSMVSVVKPSQVYEYVGLRTDTSNSFYLGVGDAHEAFIQKYSIQEGENEYSFVLKSGSTQYIDFFYRINGYTGRQPIVYRSNTFLISTTNNFITSIDKIFTFQGTAFDNDQVTLKRERLGYEYVGLRVGDTDFVQDGVGWNFNVYKQYIIPNSEEEYTYTMNHNNTVIVNFFFVTRDTVETTPTPTPTPPVTPTPSPIPTEPPVVEETFDIEIQWLDLQGRELCDPDKSYTNISSSDPEAYVTNLETSTSDLPSGIEEGERYVYEYSRHRETVANYWVIKHYYDIPKVPADIVVYHWYREDGETKEFAGNPDYPTGEYYVDDTVNPESFRKDFPGFKNDGSNPSSSFTLHEGENRIDLYYKGASPKPSIKPDGEVNQLDEDYPGIGNDEKIVVLDDIFTIELKADDETIAAVGGAKYSVKMPFDVFINGANNKAVFKAKGTTIEGLSSGKHSFRVPSYVKEQKYANGIEVKLYYTNTTNPANYSDTGKLDITVIGRLYDFTVTQLGGDTMWQNTLFGGNQKGLEYKADTLPIGQKEVSTSNEKSTGMYSGKYGTITTQPNAYKYGIKLGSSFLFSVNTKGLKSDNVVIEPRVVYYGNDGVPHNDAVLTYMENGKESEFIDSNHVVQMTTDLSTVLNHALRLNPEVTQELAKANALKTMQGIADNAYTNFTVAKSPFGNTQKLESITKALRLPFVNYFAGEPKGEVRLIGADVRLGDAESATGYKLKDFIRYNNRNDYFGQVTTSEDQILNSLGHWYADYRLPATLKVVNSSGQVVKDGYLVVYFRIYTTDAAKPANVYLRYENQNIAGRPFNQWTLENGNASKSAQLPELLNQGSTSKDIKYNNDAWFPVAIYGLERLDSDVSLTH